MRALMLCLFLAAALPQALGATNFEMEGGDLRRSNAVSATAMVAPLDLLWQSQTCLGAPNDNPMIIDGHVIMHDLYKVLSLSLGSGAEEWVWKCTALGEFYNTPAYDASRGLLYVSSMEGNLAALRFSDGAPQWNIVGGQAPGCGSYSAATFLNDTIIYCDGQGAFNCIRAADRSLVWRQAFSAPQWGCTPAIDAGLLYTAGSGGELMCLRADTGALQWRVDSPRHFISAVTLDDTRLYVMDQDGQVQCRSRADGSLIWSFQTGSFAHGNLAIDGSTLFCTSDDRFVRSLDCATGTLNWQIHHFGNFARSAPFVCGGMVFTSGCVGEFYGDRESDGSSQWVLSHGSFNSFNDWAYADGWLIGTNRSGRVFCFYSHCPNCTPTATPTPTLSSTPTPSPTATATATPSVSTSVTASITASPTATPSATPSASATPSPTWTPTATATPSATPSPSATASPSPSAPPTPVTDAPGGLDDPGRGCYTYPNPSHGGDVWAVYRVAGPCQVRVRVFQSAGEPAAKVEQRHDSAGVKRCQLPTSRFAPGVYFYKVDLDYDDGRHSSLDLAKFVCTRN